MTLRRLLPMLALAVFVTACGSKNPTAPTNNNPPPAATPTRIIRLGGAMAFGSIQVGSSFTAILAITNDGNAPLTVTGMTASSGIISVITASPQSGVVQPGTSLHVTVQFSPTAPTTYAGNITVQSDATGGTNTIAFSGTGSLDGVPVFRRTGTGDNVFDLPSYVTRVRIIGTFGGFCQNFAVRIRGSLVVNEILGTCSVGIGPRYEGTHLIAGGGTVAITISSGVSWSFEEIR